MDVADLTFFSAVVRHGSISKAAQQLNTVQSNVTMRIKQLEERLGIPLFSRHSRGMTVTSAGRRLLPYAEQVAALITEATLAARDDGRVQGPLRIGAMETTAAVRLPPVLAKFHAQYPDVDLDISTGPTATLLEKVLDHSLEGAFVAAPVQHPELIAIPAFREELVLAMAPGWRDIASYRAANRVLTAIVFRSGCSYRQRLEQYFSTQGWLPMRRLEFGTVEGILGCVAANVGITLLPRAAIAQTAMAGHIRIEPIPPTEAFVDTLFVQHRDAYASAALRSFAAACQGQNEMAA
jgi:DNA-binding transcriptional LysR family regulator